MKKKLAIVVSLILVFATLFCTACSNNKAPDADQPTGLAGTEIKIGTGGTTGTYYGFCNTMATVLNDKVGSKLSVVSTGASKANILNIDDGEVDMAIVQNDVMDYAYNGTSLFEKDGEFKSFSTLGAVYAEVCQVIARADSGITTVADLKGKKVSVGDSGSGVEFNAQQILGAYDITFEDINKQNLSFQASADALKDGKIDAAFIVSGAPTNAVTSLATTNDVYLVSLDSAHIADLIEVSPYYSEATIAADVYGTPEDVTTVAIAAVIIAADSVSEDAIYAMTSTIFENLSEISEQHAKGYEASLEFGASISDVPYHPGAAKYFAEKGFEVPVK